MKTNSQIYEQKDRIFRKIMARGTRLAAKAHPETGGSEHLVHNWGNEEAKKVWESTWARWREIEKIFNGLYEEGEHRGHGGGIQPGWCRFCEQEKKARKASKRGLGIYQQLISQQEDRL